MNFTNYKNQTQRSFGLLGDSQERVSNLLKSLNAEKASYKEILELFERIQEDEKDVDERVQAERIRIGILGGRGSGKSTLANALMGVSILPESAIIFCTSIPTSISYSEDYRLDVRSDLPEYNFSKSNVPADVMKETLLKICKESENPENTKRIHEIRIGVPSKTLDGKEIVDVPGFTRGNPLHQAFAERYAKHYCDVCFVIISNHDAIQIGNHQGLDALVHCFSTRLDSTVFIINRCDESSPEDIAFVRKRLLGLIIKKTQDENAAPLILELSAKNTIQQSGNEFEFRKLLDHLIFLSSQKTVVLVKAYLERIITNFSLLRELCSLSENNLNTLEKDINSLLNVEFNAYKQNFLSHLEKDQLGDEELSLPGIPQISLDYFDLPSPLGNGAYEYAENLAQSLREQTKILDDFIQENQAVIYDRLNTRFEKQVEKFSRILQEKVNDIELSFGIKTSIESPKIDRAIPTQCFNPTEIERLKPLPMRVWVEKSFSRDSVLTRDIKFWKSPLSLKLGWLTLNLGIPVGTISITEKKMEIQKKLPEEAVSIMNAYVHSALDEFAAQLFSSYKKSLEKYFNEWENTLKTHKSRIKAAKLLTSTASLKSIDEFIAATSEASIQLSIKSRPDS